MGAPPPGANEARRTAACTGGVCFETGAILRVIRDHTREAGVAELNRKLAAVCRHVVSRRPPGDREPEVITEATVRDVLGDDAADALPPAVQAAIESERRRLSANADANAAPSNDWIEWLEHLPWNRRNDAPADLACGDPWLRVVAGAGQAARLQRVTGPGSPDAPCRSRRTCSRSARRETTLPAASMRCIRACSAASSSGSRCARRMSRSSSADTASAASPDPLSPAENVGRRRPRFSSPSSRLRRPAHRTRRMALGDPLLDFGHRPHRRRPDIVPIEHRRRRLCRLESLAPPPAKWDESSDGKTSHAATGPRWRSQPPRYERQAREHFVDPSNPAVVSSEPSTGTRCRARAGWR